MYPEIQKDLNEGRCLLEWDYKKGDPPVPLLKDLYSGHRKKAKIMNFSIAYGKTVVGFMKDWNCSQEEAQQTVNAWYADRPEVLAWQKLVKQIALEKGWTKTLLGRYRNLTRMVKTQTDKYGEKRYTKDLGHGLRAAINTPIQGGAADIVVAAMVKLHHDPLLNSLGYKLLLRIHDEVILEGPSEHAEEALKRVVQVM